MGLGGIARDSIVGLNKLVHDDNDDHIVPRRHSRSGSWNNGNKAVDNDFLLQETDNTIATSGSQSSFETSLNDGLNTGRSPTRSHGFVAPAVASSTSPTPRSSAAVAAATSYNKVSATNSRSLDSYRPSQSTSPSVAPVSQYEGFQYEGYSDYYSESYNYDDYSYGSGNRGGGGGGGGGEKKNVFCCFFAPWMQPKSIELDNELKSVASALSLEEDQTTEAQEADLEPVPEEVVAASPTLSPTSGPGSTPTKPFDEKESSEPPEALPSAASIPKETNTVKFVPPPSAETEKLSTPHMMAMSTSHDSGLFEEEKKHEDGDLAVKPHLIATEPDVQEQEEEEEGPPPVKGILKVKRCSILASRKVLSKRSSISKVDKEPTPSPTNKRHLFPSYEPKNGSSSSGEKGVSKSIDFNPMARVLSIPSRKDIPLHQKAQVWWQRCDYDEFKKTGRIISKAMECGGSEIWLASSNAWGNRAAQQKSFDRTTSDSDDEYNKALSKYVNEEKKDEGNGEGLDTPNKWWCKFGHSRRGLEHVASSSEGRARQQSVLLAIRMIMEEQKRQRISRMKDPNKLRNVAMQYTSWARDLALAGGSADAEAVASGFNPAAASRAHHFAKRLNVCSNSLHTLHQRNDVGGGVAMAVTSQILDANTHYKPRTKNNKPRTSKDVNMEHNHSENMSKRATGYMPGVGSNAGFRAVKV